MARVVVVVFVDRTPAVHSGDVGVRRATTAAAVDDDDDDGNARVSAVADSRRMCARSMSRAVACGVAHPSTGFAFSPRTARASRNDSKNAVLLLISITKVRQNHLFDNLHALDDFWGHHPRGVAAERFFAVA